MFAQFPAVQVTRERSDFFLPSGQLRTASMSTIARAEGTHRVILGVGTNMGERVGNISKALKELAKERKEGSTKVVATSAMYESDPMYVTDQAAFLNAAVEVRSLLSLSFLRSPNPRHADRDDSLPPLPPRPPQIDRRRPRAREDLPQRPPSDRSRHPLLR